MSRKDHERRSSFRKPQRTKILVVVEGRVTEPEYIAAVKRSRRMDSIEVLVEQGHTDPIGIVNHAKARRRQAGRTDPFDQVWCVFDVEAKLTQQARHGLREALDSATRADISIALSNPCFEIWLLWHRADQTGQIDSHAVQRRCVEVGITHPEGGKHILDGDSLVGSCFGAATTRARDADRTHDRNGAETPEDRNPSSGVYRLIEAIYAAFPARS
jgi:transposase InsO family protein